MNAGWYVNAEVGRVGTYEAATKALAIDPSLSSATSLAAGNDDEAIRVMSPWFDENFFCRPSIEAFITDMRDPETGRSALKEWIEYRKANTDTHVWAAFSGAYYLAFDHLDLYIEAIDSYGPLGKPRSAGPLYERQR